MDLWMSHKRAHVVIPEDLAAEIDQVAGKRGRSHFLVEAARLEISRHRMIRAISQAAGPWKDDDHPELSRGAASHVTTMRRQSERRPRTRTPARTRRSAGTRSSRK
jgi:hypothetical protein